MPSVRGPCTLAMGLVGLFGGCGSRTGILPVIEEVVGASSTATHSSSSTTTSSSSASSAESSTGCHEICDGTCAPGGCVVTLAAGQSAATEIAIDASNVYWSTHAFPGVIASVPKSGGATTTLVAGLDVPGGIAVDNLNVYFRVDSVVVAVPKMGGPVVTLAENQPSGRDLAADGTNVYWSVLGSFDDGDVVQVGRTGADIVTLASGESLADSVVTDGDHVFWLAAAVSGGAVMRANVGGGDLITLAAVNAPRAVVVDASNVYWFAETMIVREPLVGGPATTLASGEQGSLASAAVNANGLYWTDARKPNGKLQTVGLEGGPRTTLVSGLDSPVGIATDETRIYWVESEGGFVKKLTPTCACP